MALPLTALFVDCDSYFASVEQQLDPSLRGRPVGVAPVMADTSCCIAASYEAKAFGVKTGTGVAEARGLCPGIRIVPAQVEQYIRHHHRVVEAVESCVHVEAVLSIDEMWAWLPTNLREPGMVEGIGRRIKEAVARDVGEWIKVSVGAAPNKYLAKLASKMRKPDGLFIIEHADLPEVLYPLKLRDIHGVGAAMEARLIAANILTVKDLCHASREHLHAVWGGVLGDRLWHLLRGVEIPDLVSARKSIGHSHVLPPDSRKPDQAWGVLCKLLHKACERLRAHGMLAGGLSVTLSYLRGPAWQVERRFDPTESTLHLVKHLGKIWEGRPDPRGSFIQVGIVLGGLVEKGNYTPSLFQEVVAEAMADDPDATAARHRRLDETIDKLRARFGKKVVYFGGIQESREAAPMRISFTHIPDIEREGDGELKPTGKELMRQRPRGPGSVFGRTKNF